MKQPYLLFLVFCMVILAGCGQSASKQNTPSGNDLQSYLAEHPEIANSTEPESND